jgi:hypothetical protein
MLLFKVLLKSDIDAAGVADSVWLVVFVFSDDDAFCLAAVAADDKSATLAFMALAHYAEALAAQLAIFYFFVIEFHGKIYQINDSIKN